MRLSRQRAMERWIAILIFGALAAGTFAGCVRAQEPSPPEPPSTPSGDEEMTPTDTPGVSAPSTPSSALALRLGAFADGGAIPDRYTCGGENASPSLSWSGVPVEARSLALIVYDADAGPGLGAGTDLGFIHWMVYDLPPSSAGLPEGATGNAQALDGGIESPNDFFKASGGSFPGGAAIRGTGYDGPCPPGEHTYVFRLLALDEPLALPTDSPPQAVLDALEGHVVAAADWTGTYSPAP
jgi:Raf kinase inhibitor-like YbhB/YbcL family protein